MGCACIKAHQDHKNREEATDMAVRCSEKLQVQIDAVHDSIKRIDGKMAETAARLGSMDRNLLKTQMIGLARSKIHQQRELALLESQQKTVRLVQSSVTTDRSSVLELLTFVREKNLLDTSQSQKDIDELESTVELLQVKQESMSEFKDTFQSAVDAANGDADAQAELMAEQFLACYAGPTAIDLALNRSTPVPNSNTLNRKPTGDGTTSVILNDSSTSLNRRTTPKLAGLVTS